MLTTHEETSTRTTYAFEQALSAQSLPVNAHRNRKELANELESVLLPQELALLLAWEEGARIILFLLRLPDSLIQDPLALALLSYLLFLLTLHFVARLANQLFSLTKILRLEVSIKDALSTKARGRLIQSRQYEQGNLETPYTDRTHLESRILERQGIAQQEATTKGTYFNWPTESATFKHNLSQNHGKEGVQEAIKRLGKQTSNLVNQNPNVSNCTVSLPCFQVLTALQ